MTAHDQLDDDQADQLDDDDAPTYDPLAALTVDELNTGSRQLKASLVRAVAGETEDYERGLAVTLWLHARRRDPGTKLAPFMGLTFLQLQEQLGELGPDEDRPTAPTPGP